MAVWLRWKTFSLATSGVVVRLHESTNHQPRKRVVSLAFIGENGKETGPYNIERMPEGEHRPATDEELASFKAWKKAKPKAPKLLNPSREQAEILQKLVFDSDKEAAEIVEMTQAKYSYISKGSDWVFPCFVAKSGKYEYYKPNVKKLQEAGEILFRVRTVDGDGYGSPRRVVVITNKKQHDLPLEQIQEAKEKAEVVA